MWRFSGSVDLSQSIGGAAWTELTDLAASRLICSQASLIFRPSRVAHGVYPRQHVTIWQAHYGRIGSNR